MSAVLPVAVGVAINRVEGAWWVQAIAFGSAVVLFGISQWVLRVLGPQEVAEVRSDSVVVGEVPREPHAFQPRAALMTALEQGARAERVVVCAVTGTRGVGKTQLAAAYARRRASEGWPLVAWVNAENKDLFLAGLDAVAQAVDVAVAGEDAEQGARRLRQWLAGHPGPCLLVVDNLTDADAADTWLPAVGRTQIVITSNRREVHALGRAVQVDVFTPAEAVSFLQQRSGLADEKGALSLAEQVGRLPLALAQAAWVIRRQRLDYATYRERLSSVNLDEVLPAVPGESYRQGAAQAVGVSLAQLETSPSVALERGLLQLLAVLSPAGVPRSWLYRAGALRLVPGVSAKHSMVRIDEAIGALSDASLVVMSVDDQAVLMHRFIQQVIRHNTRGKGKARWSGLIRNASELVWECGPQLARVVLDREERETFIEQAAVLREHAAGDLPMDVINRILLLSTWAGRYLEGCGDLKRAIPLLEQNLDDRIQALGADHPDTLNSRNNLASACQTSGNLGRAIPLYEQNFDDRLRVLGPDHPDTLNSRNNLASACQMAGDLTRTVSLFEFNLSERTRLLGPDHPDTLSSRNNLATAYQSARDLGRPIPLHEKTLSDRIRVLGPDHPSVLASRNNLASAYQAAGDLVRAVPMFEQTFRDYVRVVGAEHPGTLSCRNNLASAYQAAGDLAKAVAMFEQNLDDRVRLLRAEHPDTLQSRNNLAVAYRAAGDLKKAILLFERNLADRLRVLGGEHPETLQSCNNLAVAYRVAGDLKRAIPAFEQAIANYARALGPLHPDSLQCRNNLAVAYRAAGQRDRAKEMFEQILADCAETLGAQHPITLAVQKNQEA
ncbi:tetratricopeptide repeat protein [Herbidospora sp. NEAU-GS84]|uniref:Tetratricopeptide repeat protein n=1 Tax=Herbidospora solisilvae TaxID=2696284 RepID=A0A7C9J0C9_9ACTN|nr:tetratricopeptide repeat protein [Herbidospora solisilvae]NAS20080.1 tetratricopeptide repeat protein [Herbidospora solisilvae]